MCEPACICMHHRFWCYATCFQTAFSMSHRHLGAALCSEQSLASMPIMIIIGVTWKGLDWSCSCAGAGAFKSWGSAKWQIPGTPCQLHGVSCQSRGGALKLSLAAKTLFSIVKTSSNMNRPSICFDPMQCAYELLHVVQVVCYFEFRMLTDVVVLACRAIA